MTNEATAARNQRRAYRKQADMLMVESELLLARHLNALLKESPGDLTVPQAALLPVLVDMIGKLKDQRLAASWTSKLADAIRANPRLLDGAPGMKALHKVAGMAGKVVKAATPDRREQAERKREEGICKLAEAYGKEPSNLPPGATQPETPKKRGDSFLDDLPDDPA